MRTLKKSLALVLALVMVLGLAVVGASADNALDNFTDLDQLDANYVEAAGVMNGLGIINGISDTVLDPNGTYTREQAAKIITYMLLGKTKAEALTATDTPFEDVPDGHWSAKYISFCVEQGIIDGMSPTSFEPFATLTGYQWAKMLLAAVGFGANGEFTGNSWSDNTALVAAQTDLFNGDYSGGDHVALRREQAILYAFNTLTGIKEVTYTSNGNNYVYDIFGYYWADGTGKTLGQFVYDLYSAQGIIVSNEGVGNDYTLISKDYTAADASIVAKVSADSDIFEIGHAARAWYVDPNADKVGDCVYLYDMAKVTSYDCYAIEDGKDAFNKIDVASTDKHTSNLGLTTDGIEYEYDIVDNTALGLGYNQVSFFYKTGSLGVRSEINGTTVPVVNGAAVKNENIWTDISDIDRGDSIIYITHGGIYYVYPVTTTVGAVDEITSKGVITLTDGTVLQPSKLNSNLEQAVIDIRTAVVDPTIATPKYVFFLDTHGHWYNPTADSLKAVAYWTGDLTATSAHDALSSDVTYDALFARVADGTIVRVPVTNTWIQNHVSFSIDTTGKLEVTYDEGYYDITDSLNGNTRYTPYKISATEKTNGYGDYEFADSLTVKGSTNIIDGIVFNPSTVTYYIAKDYGSSLVVDKYVGNAALIAAYSAEGRPVTEVTLNNVAVLTTKSDVGNDTATVIFAYNDVESVRGGTLFLPNGLKPADWNVGRNSYIGFFENVYLDGVALDDETANVIWTKTSSAVYTTTYVPGFYNYVLDADGYVTNLIPVSTQVNTTSNELKGTDGTYYLLDGKELASDVIVCDVRANADKLYDGIYAVTDFFDNYASQDAPVLDLVYTTNSASQIDVIYVVDSNTYTVTADWYNGEANNWNNAGENKTCTIDLEGEGPYSIWGNTEHVVTVILTNDADHSHGGDFEFDVYVNGTFYDTFDETTKDASDATKLSFTVTVDGPAEILVGNWE